MTYDEFYETVLNSKKEDWLQTETGSVYKPDISIFIEWSLFDEEIDQLTADEAERFDNLGGYNSSAAYRLLYNGTEIHRCEMHSVGSFPYYFLIPAPEVFVYEDDIVEASELEAHICYLLSPPIDEDEYKNGLLKSAKVTVVKGASDE